MYINSKAPGDGDDLEVYRDNISDCYDTVLTLRLESERHSGVLLVNQNGETVSRHYSIQNAIDAGRLLDEEHGNIAFSPQVENPVLYCCEDGGTALTGERVFSVYPYCAGIIGEPTTDGWFNFYGEKGRTDQLNGDRICSAAYSHRYYAKEME